MEQIADYEILTNSSSSLQVRHKSTGQLFHLQPISVSHLAGNEQKVLRKKLTIRKILCHPNILQFYEPVQRDAVLYLKQEFCQFGTLANFILQECKGKARRLHEHLICRILYQMVFALKTVECFMGRLSVDTVLLNNEFIVKLYNFFSYDKKNKLQKQKEVKMSQLGALIFELCTLKPFDKSSFETEIEAEKSYSEALKSLVISMIKDNTEIKKHINKILCHPTVLLQSSQWSPETCFTDKQVQSATKLSSSDIVEGNDLTEKLKRKEAALLIKEQLLKEQERKLMGKQQKLLKMEQTVQNKLQEADIYLQRCKDEAKSVCGSCSGKSSNRSSKILLEETGYASYEDSDMFPTSTKLLVNKIIKPSNFSRTMSEKRIRFKTSPLKDRNFVRKNHERKSAVKHSKEKCYSKKPDDKENVQKTLFAFKEYENEVITSRLYNNATSCDVNNVGWNKETKKYAFEMLRVLNSVENDGDIKHTVL